MKKFTLKITNPVTGKFLKLSNKIQADSLTALQDAHKSLCVKLWGKGLLVNFCEV